MYFVYPKIKIKQLLKVCFCCFFKPFSVQELKNRLNKFFPDKEIIFTDSGRSAFAVIIEKFNLRGSEIIFPAYICDIFFDIFRQYNIKPIFIDADIKTAGLEITEIGRRITPGTKAIFICHTYGLAGDIDEVVDICKKCGLLLIEDCAHTLLGYADSRGLERGFTRKTNCLGNFGQAAIFSFPKVMPIFGGGMAIWDKKFDSHELPRKFFSLSFLVGFLKSIEVVSCLYYAILRRNFPPLFQSFSSFKRGGGSGGLFYSNIVLKYFSCLLNGYEKKLKKRTMLGKSLLSKINSAARNCQICAADNFSFFTILLSENLASKRNEIVEKLSRKRIFCERIWHNPIITWPEVIKEYGIDPNSFPNTLSIAKRVINLPLQDYFNERDIERVVDEFLKSVNDTI